MSSSSPTLQRLMDAARSRENGALSMLLERIAELEDAIRNHRSQRADDRCIEDDDELYAVLYDGIKCDRSVGDKAAMLHNCERFIANRCESGGPWKSYTELEAEVARLTEENERLKRQ